MLIVTISMLFMYLNFEKKIETREVQGYRGLRGELGQTNRQKPAPVRQ